MYIFVAFIDDNKQVQDEKFKESSKHKNLELRSMRTVESGNTENDIFEMKKLNMVSLNLLSLK